MKTSKIKNIFCALGLLASVGCTDLTETTYDIIPQDQFYQTKENVLQGFVRPFGHGYWLCRGAMYWIGELSADHYMTVQREEHWYNGGEFFRYHYHTWTIDDSAVSAIGEDTYRGIMQCNASIYDLNRLNPEDYGFTQQDFNDFIQVSQVLK